MRIEEKQPTEKPTILRGPLVNPHSEIRNQHFTYGRKLLGLLSFSGR